MIKKPFKKILPLLLILFLYQIVLGSLFDDRYPSARATAMGGSGAAVANDVWAAYYNPAGLAQLNRISVGTSYLRLFNVSFLSNFFGAVNYPLPGKYGSTSLNFQYFGVNYKDENLSGEYTLSFSHGFYLLKDIHRMIDLNFTTAYNIARPLFRHMRSAGRGGKIIFIGARPVLQPVQAKDMVAYTFSKSLLLRLSEIINAQSDGTGIYSYVIVPGIIDTPRNRKSMPDADFSKWISAAEISRKIGSILSEPGSEPEDKIIPMYRGS